MDFTDEINDLIETEVNRRIADRLAHLPAPTPVYAPPAYVDPWYWQRYWGHPYQPYKVWCSTNTNEVRVDAK